MQPCYIEKNYVAVEILALENQTGLIPELGLDQNAEYNNGSLELIIKF
jgi:hypothetical protein